MPDDPPRKGQQGPHFPSPASGVRARTSREEDRRSAAIAAARIEEESTPVNMPVPRLVERINERTKASSITTDSISRRVEALETGLADARVDIAHVATELGGLDSKVDVLVEEAVHTRREREEREKRAENRADEELRFRRERAFKIIAIVVPTLTALGALIAGIIAATRSPDVRYVAPSSPASIRGSASTP